MIIEPHVGDGHTVLGEGTGLVRADGGGGSESLHGFQVLHQTVLGGHTLGSQSQTDLSTNNKVIKDQVT